MKTMREQLILFGADGLAERKPAPEDVRRVAWASEIASSNPEEIAYLHAGLCLAALPHRKPRDEFATWSRVNGNYHLVVRPGIMPRRGQEVVDPIGLPYGTRARLILIYLMGEAVRTRSADVPLGSGLSAWVRRIGLPVSGGPRGSIGAIREQALRVARCSWTLRIDNNERTAIIDGRIVDGFEAWAGEGANFPEFVQIDQKFFNHLIEHAVPLDERAIARLKRSALSLDLYVWLAYRLPRLTKPLFLRWDQLSSHFGTEDLSERSFGQNVRAALEDVLACYPDAKVEAVRGGLRLSPSAPSVPKRQISVLQPLHKKL